MSSRPKVVPLRPPSPPEADGRATAAPDTARKDGLQFDVLRPRAVAAPGGTLWTDEPMHLTVAAPESAGHATARSSQFPPTSRAQGRAIHMLRQ